jgi:hypothetical protein
MMSKTLKVSLTDMRDCSKVCSSGRDERSQRKPLGSMTYLDGLPPTGTGGGWKRGRNPAGGGENLLTPGKWDADKRGITRIRAFILFFQ